MYEETVLLAVLAVNVILQQAKRKRRKRRTKWTKGWLLKRNKYSHTNLWSDLRLESSDWHNYLRMDQEQFFDLLSLVSPLIRKQDTCMRAAITPHERLTATLRFLATGRSFEDLKYTTIISPQALGIIVPDTCRAIYAVLQEMYMKFPSTEREWQNISKGFEDRCNFPHNLGAIDGKHVWIIPPADSGAFYYNYKGYNSLVLLAIANANCEFVLCDFGTNGRVSDGGVISNTNFYRKLVNGALNIPRPGRVGNSELDLPYVFVGDDAFALRPDLLKPFSYTDLDPAHRIYNYRISRARRIIENVFGILVARFRIFHTPINMDLHKIDDVVMACCVLHNYLRKTCPTRYTPCECLDFDDSGKGSTTLGLRPDEEQFVGLQNGMVRNATNDAKAVRVMYVNYFNTEGKVPWQDSV